VVQNLTVASRLSWRLANPGGNWLSSDAVRVPSAVSPLDAAAHRKFGPSETPRLAPLLNQRVALPQLERDVLSLDAYKAI
jgi:hypothetical protein